jgi:hypothetical protein
VKLLDTYSSFPEEITWIYIHWLLPEILKSKSEEFRLDWEINVEAEYEACVKNSSFQK